MKEKLKGKKESDGAKFCSISYNEMLVRVCENIIWQARRLANDDMNISNFYIQYHHIEVTAKPKREAELMNQLFNSIEVKAKRANMYSLNF